MIGNDPGQFPSLFPQRIQLFFTWRFFFREIAREALVLPEGFVFYVDHRCNWHFEVPSVDASLLAAKIGISSAGIVGLVRPVALNLPLGGGGRIGKCH